MDRKFGFVSLTGRTNVGKSTLLNSLFQKKISITSRKPQTTRNRILGILSKGNNQIVFLDSPGVHVGYKRALNKYMNKTARACYEEVDLVVFVVDRGKWQKEEDSIIKNLKELNKPILLAINKIDRVKNNNNILPIINELNSKYPFEAIIPVSALKKVKVDLLLSKIIETIPVGEFHYPIENEKEFSKSFFISEIIREKAINRLGDELPYRINVQIEKIDEGKSIQHIHSNIHVESSSQKAILLGKNGAMIKSIGMSSRKELEKELKSKVNLQLRIKVKKNWTNDINLLSKYGYD